ncbi:branched-chain amino acid aminotransferase/4-amino-4-deoxychorismate lyase [Solibacillus silvestris StLB046]|uniref:D-alanine aminotransferase n=1 Tax=Solibacillus silvestris (strain StLB046) TaxID=1002809 RepID=F2F7S3_SOLSS|nr:D-amino-acid transaminase [Solibacillus silvestris]BAK15548.1 branched-chain amino acid aminotransferase/4-amino-4-deoxychorismate lyase [Solibacillus silvestris StLB046]
MSFSLWNDQIVKNEEVLVDKEDRGYQFGDGVYEVVKVYNGELFTATEHIDRFYDSAEKIRITIPYTKDKLHQLLHQLVEANNIDTGHVYFQITRGAGPRNHIFPGDDVKPVITGNAKENPRPLENFEKGVKATFVEDIRWLRCDIKSLNLLGAVLAKQEAYEKGCYEAILHREEIVTEGSSSNIYGIKDGVLYTHPANNLILNGITRQVIIKCAAEIGLTVNEQAMTKEQLLAMEEVIVSSTTSEVTPVIEIDGTVIGNGTLGEWTRKLQAQFETKIPKGIKA